MLPHGVKSKTMKLRRVADDGAVKDFDIQGIDLGQKDGLTFSVDADVEIGDEVTEILPNGKSKTMRLREVQVHQSPFATGRLDHTAAKYEVVSDRAALRQPTPITLPGLHSLISTASGSQVASRHYDNAVFDAFKAVEDRVKKLTGETDIGRRLMTSVFNEQNPLLDITSDNADADQQDDEREGFRFLFMGGAQGIRNPRGHGPDLATDEQEALEMLAFASLLMRRLDRAEAHQQQDGQQ